MAERMNHQPNPLAKPEERWFASHNCSQEGTRRSNYDFDYCGPMRKTAEAALAAIPKRFVKQDD